MGRSYSTSAYQAFADIDHAGGTAPAPRSIGGKCVALLAAGAVVTKDVPPYTVIVSVPTRVVKRIENDLDGWSEGELLASAVKGVRGITHIEIRCS